MTTDEERRAVVTKADADLRFVLDDASVDLELQYSMVNAGFSVDGYLCQGGGLPARVRVAKVISACGTEWHFRQKDAELRPSEISTSGKTFAEHGYASYEAKLPGVAWEEFRSRLRLRPWRTPS
jgi:hypothetical protein